MVKRVRIPQPVLAAEVRAGHITADGRGVRSAMGALGGLFGGLAESGLDKAGESGSSGPGLKFPNLCCKCTSETGVRAVHSVSAINRGADYSFRFRIPHCSRCADTANRGRPGFLGRVAAFLIISVPSFIVMLFFGALTNRDALIAAGFVVGPLLGVALPSLWIRLRGAGGSGRSRYQAVYVSAIDVGLSGTPEEFTLAFENPTYARQFLALNEAAGASESLLDSE